LREGTGDLLGVKTIRSGLGLVGDETVTVNYV
jgi:hypothetical protein